MDWYVLVANDLSSQQKISSAKLNTIRLLFGLFLSTINMFIKFFRVRNLTQSDYYLVYPLSTIHS